MSTSRREKGGPRSGRRGSCTLISKLKLDSLIDYIILPYSVAFRPTMLVT